MVNLKKYTWLLALAALDASAQSRQLTGQQQCEADVEAWTRSFETTINTNAGKLGAVRTNYFQAQRQRVLNLLGQYKIEDPANRDCQPLAEQAKNLGADLQAVLTAINTPTPPLDPAQSKKEIERCDGLIAAWNQRYGSSLQQEKASKRINRISLMQLDAQQERIPALYATLKADGLTPQECDQVIHEANAALTNLNSTIATATTGPRPVDPKSKEMQDKQRLSCINEVERWSQAFNDGLEKAKVTGKIKNSVQRARLTSAVKAVKNELARYESEGTTAKNCATLITAMKAWDKELNGL